MIRRLSLALGLVLLVARGVAAEGETVAPPVAPTAEGALRLLGEGKLMEALDAAKGVPDGAADATKARYVVGELELLLGDPAAAKEAFEAVLAKKPSPAASAGVGRAALAVGDADGAIAPLETAVKDDPTSARARAWLGLARIRAEKKADGLKDLSAAEKADPTDVEVVRALVEGRLEADEATAAAHAVATLVKKRKDEPFGPFLDGVVLERAGKHDDAIAAYLKAIKLDPAFLDARRNLAILCVTQNPLYQDAKRTTIALEQLAEYKRLGGRDPSVLRLAEILPTFAKPAK